MRYKELKIRVTREELGLTETVLIENGFCSMQIDDPRDAADIAEHPDLYKYDYINEEILQEAAESKTITLTLYFAEDEEGNKQFYDVLNILARLEANGADIRCEVYAAGDDSEWLYKWQEHFKPAKIGERIVVKPSWEDHEAADGELVIEMDPGMAFGSGLHATTSMCIKALEKAMGGEYNTRRGSPASTEAPAVDQTASSCEPAALKVLDVGTGTGILAMAAVLLGADEALGIDIDEEAVRVSNENIIRNGLADRIRILQGNLVDGIDYEADVIVANLMADLVVMLSPAAAAQLKAGGMYITSGILDIKEEIVKKAIETAGFDIIEVLTDGEWRAIIARRK